MKSPPFDYIKPRSLDEVFALLEQHGDDARILAGGQTLLATLNMRLSEPLLLIDIKAIEALKGIRIEGSVLRIGALVTNTEIEASALVAQHAPMLAQAAPHIAHRAIRNLGTFGGSLAYADPSAEWPACILALDAQVVLRGARGERKVAASEFFKGLYSTAAQPDELIAACEIPLCQPGEVQDFSELARRHGDYAVAGIALRALPAPGTTADTTTDTACPFRIALLGLSDRPVRALAAERLLSSSPLSKERIDEAVKALGQDFEAIGDLAHQGPTKLHVAGVLLRRALQRLASRSAAAQ